MRANRIVAVVPLPRRAFQTHRPAEAFAEPAHDRQAHALARRIRGIARGRTDRRRAAAFRATCRCRCRARRRGRARCAPRSGRCSVNVQALRSRLPSITPAPAAAHAAAASPASTHLQLDRLAGEQRPHLLDFLATTSRTSKSSRCGSMSPSRARIRKASITASMSRPARWMRASERCARARQVRVGRASGRWRRGSRSAACAVRGWRRG